MARETIHYQAGHEHTPGPWTAEQRTLHCLDPDSPTESAGVPIDGDGWHIVGPPLGGMVDDMLNGYFAKPADAHLIAAAPDLYDALWVAESALSIASQYVHREQATMHKALDVARAAITKARGEGVPG